MDQPVTQEQEDKVLEAVKSLGLQAELVNESPETMWHIETEFGKLYLRILGEGSYLLLCAIYERPDELSPASAMAFANKWNFENRFSKLALHPDDDKMVLEYTAYLQDTQLAGVRKIIAEFHSDLLNHVQEIRKELK